MHSSRLRLLLRTYVRICSRFDVRLSMFYYSTFNLRYSIFDLQFSILIRCSIFDARWLICNVLFPFMDVQFSRLDACYVRRRSRCEAQYVRTYVRILCSVLGLRHLIFDRYSTFHVRSSRNCKCSMFVWWFIRVGGLARRQKSRITHSCSFCFVPWPMLRAKAAFGLYVPTPVQTMPCNAAGQNGVASSLVSVDFARACDFFVCFLVCQSSRLLPTRLLPASAMGASIVHAASTCLARLCCFRVAHSCCRASY